MRSQATGDGNRAVTSVLTGGVGILREGSVPAGQHPGFAGLARLLPAPAPSAREAARPPLSRQAASPIGRPAPEEPPGGADQRPELDDWARRSPASCQHAARVPLTTSCTVKRPKPAPINLQRQP